LKQPFLPFTGSCFSFVISFPMTSLSYLLKHPWIMAATGGALGSVARVIVSTGVTRWTGDEFPFGTVVVNVSGAFVMGLLAGYGQTEPGRLLLSEPARTFLMIGVLGGYTTFSSFSLQTFILMEQGNLLGASLNVLISVLICLAGVWGGFALIRALV
jgi:CrcB protein